MNSRELLAIYAPQALGLATAGILALYRRFRGLDEWRLRVELLHVLVVSCVLAAVAWKLGQGWPGMVLAVLGGTATACGYNSRAPFSHRGKRRRSAGLAEISHGPLSPPRLPTVEQIRELYKRDPPSGAAPG